MILCLIQDGVMFQLYFYHIIYNLKFSNIKCTPSPDKYSLEEGVIFYLNMNYYEVIYFLIFSL